MATKGEVPGCGISGRLDGRALAGPVEGVGNRQAGQEFAVENQRHSQGSFVRGVVETAEDDSGPGGPSPFGPTPRCGVVPTRCRELGKPGTVRISRAAPQKNPLPLGERGFFL